MAWTSLLVNIPGSAIDSGRFDRKSFVFGAQEIELNVID
jgi:hypothetical protein